MLTINAIWLRLRLHEGSTFRTKTGPEFTYEINDAFMVTSKSPYRLPKSDFALALEMVPFHGPGDLRNKVRGTSYVWAVLHDPRIRLDDY